MALIWCLTLSLTILAVSISQSTGQIIPNYFKWQPSAEDDAPDPNVIFPMVTTPLGQLRGTSLSSRSGKLYYAYRGIPYAQPPLRFHASVPVEPWSGLLDATEFGTICAQADSTGAVIGGEDCLFLNVYFPHHERCIEEESASGKLPVFIHIHGGSFLTRSSSQFGAKYLLDECIVYVSINYRLGALGLLTTGDDVIPGNLALKDQVLALTWVQQYISHFRGDPANVNINGISAGGSSISHLVTSPMAKGLFHTAIASSGSIMNPWSVEEDPGKYAMQLGGVLGCTPLETSEDLKTCLTQLDLETIILKQNSGRVTPFAPTIEPKTAAAPFQTENPAVLLRNGEFNRVPLLTGFILDEGIGISAGPVLADPALTDMLNTEWYQMAPSIFLYDDFNLNQTEKDRISTDIRQFYFADKDIGLETRQELTNLYSDRYFVQGVMENVELHSMYAPVYAYVMTYNGGLSFAVSNSGYEIPVITHGDDIQFLYHPFMDDYEEFAFGTDQYEFSKKLVKHWTHFAKTGTPASLNGDGLWNATTGDLYHQLDIVDGDQFNYLTERHNFWKNLGLYEYEFN